MFATMIGTPIEPRNVNRHFDKLCNSTGVRRIRFRTSSGTRNPRTTKTTYVDIAENLQRDAIDRLGFLFEGPDE